MNFSKFGRSALCLLLVTVLCVFALAACNSEVGSDASDNSKPVQETSGTESVAFPYPDFHEDVTITILCVEKARHLYGELQFVPDEESNFSAVSEAVRDRNNLIEQNTGIKIEVEAVKYPTETMRTWIDGNTMECNIVCDSVDRMMQCVPEHLFWSIDGKFDLTRPWWDETGTNAISIGNKHFFLMGDALITDDDNTYLYLYNKKMYSENTALSGEYGDIYKLVRDGKWTLDVFREMCKQVSHADESGNWGMTATYGNLSHSYGATVLMNGCNFATASPNEQGTFTLNVGSQLGISMFDKVYEIMSDTQLTQRAELIAGQGKNPSQYGFSELEEMFVAGRGLFYNTTSSSISILKSQQMDFEFGVLPTPKYDEQQTRYCNTVNRYQSSVLGIPVTVTDSEMDATVVLLEALGYYSAPVKKAYYEQTLQLQALTDNADADMLDLVYSSRFYDVGAMFDWGGGKLSGLYGSIIANANSNAIVSKWEEVASSVETDMNATIEAFMNSVT